jgi:hypothetical protein
MTLRSLRHLKEFVRHPRLGPTHCCWLYSPNKRLFILLLLLTFYMVKMLREHVLVQHSKHLSSSQLLQNELTESKPECL